MWSLDGTTALLQAASLQARLDLKCPARGLMDIQVGLEQQAFQRIPARGLLQVTPAGQQRAEAQIEDHYVRGNDLVVTYAAAPSLDVHPVLYWRILEAGDVKAIGIELIVSVETGLLNSDPASATTSVLSVSEILQLGSDQRFERFRLEEASQPAQAEGPLLFRLLDQPVSYVEMVHPADLCGIRVATEDPAGCTARSSCQLFSGKLEKGVIRRGRLRAYFLPHRDDTSTAAALYRDFVASAPPLST